jgi:hypothetical protein
MNDEPRGCLAFLFGFGSPSKPPLDKNTVLDNSEGNAHSGPGGYEDGSYHGGYAADYFDEGGYEEH